MLLNKQNLRIVVVICTVNWQVDRLEDNRIDAEFVLP